MSSQTKGQAPCQDAEVIEEVRRSPKNNLTPTPVQATILEPKEEPAVENIQIIGWIIAGISAFVLAIAGLLYLTKDKDN